MLNPSTPLTGFKKSADVLNRSDVFCLSAKHIGCDTHGELYLMRYGFANTLPTRVQLQAALNRDFGQQAVIDPTSVMAGKLSMVAEVHCSHKITEQAGPKNYVANLREVMNDQPVDKIVEIGDIVRYFNAMVVEGQVVGFDGPMFAIRTGATIESVAADSVIDVKQSPKFFPVDETAYDYYTKIYPVDFVNKLTVTDPMKLIFEKAPAMLPETLKPKTHTLPENQKGVTHIEESQKPPRPSFPEVITMAPKMVPENQKAPRTIEEKK